MKKQTAVEWLIEQVERHLGDIPLDVKKQAKGMQRQQTIEAHEAGYSDGWKDNGTVSSQYFTETYGE